MSGEKLILASSSPTRKQLLQAADICFEALSPHVDEDAIKSGWTGTPRDLAFYLAEVKSIKCSMRYPEALVLGADQVLHMQDDQMFSKPTSRDEARQHLKTLRGKPHFLTSAAVISQGGTPIWREGDKARLDMRDFSDDFIEAYLDRHMDLGGPDILQKVGTYQLEGLGVQLFARISGDYFTILGMPLLGILNFLRERGVLES